MLYNQVSICLYYKPLKHFGGLILTEGAGACCTIKQVPVSFGA